MELGPSIVSPSIESNPGKGDKALGDNVRPATSSRDQPLSAILAQDEENLGSQYAKSPWLKPSKEKTEAHIEDEKYKGGRAKVASLMHMILDSACINCTHGYTQVWSTTIDDLASMGVGIDLYFRVLKYVAILMGILTMFCIPILVLNRYHF
jgi:hypothetical protein